LIHAKAAQRYKLGAPRPTAPPLFMTLLAFLS
jgi:hypothetical protein